MKAKFVIKRSSTGRFYFIFVACNGKVVATSEIYQNRRNAVKGIKSIKKFAGKAVIVNE